MSKSSKRLDGPSLLTVCVVGNVRTVWALRAGQHIHLWGKEGSEWVCKAILEEGHQRYGPAGIPHVLAHWW